MNRQRRKKLLMILTASTGTFVILVTATLFLMSGIQTFPNYLEPWNQRYAQQFTDPRIRLAAHGLLAANGHNMQPWSILLDETDLQSFYLYADGDRSTSEVDPYSRQMMITQGTFLEYIKIAGEEWGNQVIIALFPEDNDNETMIEEGMHIRPVAKITLVEREPQANSLYDAMFLPTTNRIAYRQETLTAKQLYKMEHINAEEDIFINVFQDDNNVAKLSDYAMRAAVVEASTARVMQESEVIFRANEYQKNRYRYGFSVEGQGTSGIMRHLLQGIVTLFPSMNQGNASADLLIQSTQISVSNTPAYILIISEDNSRINQVKSGMLYSKLVLEAHRLGLVMQPLSQVLEEYPEMQELYHGIHQDYAANGGTIQMLVRVGIATKEAPQSMRRDILDLIMDRD